MKRLRHLAAALIAGSVAAAVVTAPTAFAAASPYAADHANTCSVVHNVGDGLQMKTCLLIYRDAHGNHARPTLVVSNPTKRTIAYRGWNTGVFKLAGGGTSVHTSGGFGDPLTLKAGKHETHRIVGAVKKERQGYYAQSAVYFGKNGVTVQQTRPIPDHTWMK